MADAVKFKVVDYVTGNKNDVLKYLHRRPVRVGNRDVIINTENIAEVHHEMSIYYSVLNFFADPEIFILLVIIVFINTILLIAAYIASLVKRNFNFMNKLTLAGMVLFSISVVMIVLIVV